MGKITINNKDLTKPFPIGSGNCKEIDINAMKLTFKKDFYVCGVNFGVYNVTKQKLITSQDMKQIESISGKLYGIESGLTGEAVRLFDVLNNNHVLHTSAVCMFKNNYTEKLYVYIKDSGIYSLPALELILPVKNMKAGTSRFIITDDEKSAYLWSDTGFHSIYDENGNIFWKSSDPYNTVQDFIFNHDHGQFWVSANNSITGSQNSIILSIGDNKIHYQGNPPYNDNLYFYTHPKYGCFYDKTTIRNLDDNNIIFSIDGVVNLSYGNSHIYICTNDSVYMENEKLLDSKGFQKFFSIALA